MPTLVEQKQREDEIMTDLQFKAMVVMMRNIVRNSKSLEEADRKIAMVGEGVFFADDDKENKNDK
ncbi:hypothetical protein AGMMS49975_16160 [Clostridia bacterium]|nr:hypothetical protein AGMMS49975_16160 [Clostridia bacterium]